MRGAMMTLSRNLLLVATLACGVAFSQMASATEAAAPLKKAGISLDKETLKKGLGVFTDVCMGCHSARYLTYRDLMEYPELGLTRAEVDDIRGDAPLNSSMKSAMPASAIKQSYGVAPPDLSVIAKAREGKGDYIYSILTGYAHDPKGRIPDGNYNTYFPGHHIAMPDPLGWLGHDPADEADLKEQAHDVASFLVFISDPHQLQRHAIGKWVVGFLVLLTLVFYLLKRAVWKDVKH